MPAPAAAETAAGANRAEAAARRRSLPHQSAEHFGGDAFCRQSRQSAAFARPGGRIDARRHGRGDSAAGGRIKPALRGPDAAYRVVGEGDGYRLTLRDEFRPLRNRFYGRIREARLSQAAIDVLALVAYQQSITAETIGRLRGKPSNHVLMHLVRRGLLRIERPDAKRRTPHYYTTERFLRLFNLQSLDDLPQSEDAGPP